MVPPPLHGTDQGEAAEENHGDDGGLEVLVFDEAESLDAEGGPALPEGGVLVPRHAGKVDVALDGAAVGRVLRHQQLLGVGIQHQLRVKLQLHNGEKLGVNNETRTQTSREKPKNLENKLCISTVR